MCVSFVFHKTTDSQSIMCVKKKYPKKKKIRGKKSILQNNYMCCILLFQANIYFIN